MFTIIGKATVFLIVVTSLVGLGISVYAAIDKHDWKAERQVIVEEIARRQYARDQQRVALVLLLDEITKGNRQMPWDPETNAKPTSVSKTKQQIKDLEKEINTLLDQQNQLSVANRELVTELAKERQNYETALVEHKTLRETIKPEAPNTKGFRDLAVDQRTAKEAAEAELERLRPTVVNELVRVAQVKARLDELSARLKELQAAGSTSANIKP